MIHGKTIELLEESGLPEGQTVTVIVRADSVSSQSRESGIQAAFGGWADDAEELDEFLDWNRARRKLCRREVEP